MIKFIAKYSIPGVENGTIEECLDYITKLNIIGIDTETSRKFRKGTYPEEVYRPGLDVYVSRLVMLQVGDLNNQFVIDIRDFTKEELKLITDFLNYNDKIILVAHNAKFEAKFLKHTFGINFHTVWDTMLADICLYNGLPNDISLAGLSEKYLGVQKKREATLFGEKFKKKVITLDEELLEENDNAITPFEVEESFQLDKSTRLQFINIGDRPFTKEQVLYGSDDIIFPILIRERQLVGRKLSTGKVHRPFNWWKVENHYCLVLADLELNGMPIVPEMWNALHDKNAIILRQREEKLNKWILDNYPQYSEGTPDLFSGERKCHIQWSSPKQTVQLFKSLNICPRAYSKQTGQVEDTVGAKEVLRKLPNALKLKYQKDKDVEITDLDTFMLAYILYKKSEQATTTFGRAWVKKYVHPVTGRCHSNYRQILNTTRISSTAPNLNNVSGGSYRACFRVGEGRTMVNVDASAQELRSVAELSEDPYMMDFFIKGDEYYGEDVHSWSATKIYRTLEGNPELIVPPKEIRDEEKGGNVPNPIFTDLDGERRSNSKATTFSMIYGCSPWGLSQDLGIPPNDGEALYNGYLDTFTGIKGYFHYCEDWAKNYDYIPIEKLTGACYFYPQFQEIQNLYDQAWEYFPSGYGKLKGADKESAKKQVYAENPHVKALFQKAGRMRGSLYRRNLNYRIQGSCAIMLKISMNIFRKNCIEKDYDFKLIGNIYDEVLCDVRVEDGEVCGELVKTSMEQAGKLIFPIVPQVANWYLSDDWKH